MFGVGVDPCSRFGSVSRDAKVNEKRLKKRKDVKDM
jgi:hypothetical protein